MSAPSPSCPDDAAARRLARSMAVVSAFCLTGDTMLYIALPLFWQECGLTALWQVGVLLAVNRLVRLPLNPLVRLLYTRIDQRTGMALAVVLAASTTLMYGVAQSFALWLLLRCLWGLAWTLLRLGSLFALMAASRKDNRGYLMGSYNGLVRLGSLLGMIGGGLLADLLGFSTVALLFGALTLTGDLNPRRYVETRLYQTDSLITSNLSYGYMGSMLSDTFGLRTAGFLTQYIPYEIDSGYFGFRPILDSAIILLSISSYGSDTLTPQLYNVYEVVSNKYLTEKPVESGKSERDTTFYLNFDPVKAGAVGNEVLFTFTFPDGEKTGPATTYATMKPTQKGREFINRLMLQEGTYKGDYSIYSLDSLEQWVAEFKGLYIVPAVDQTSPNKGNIYATSLDASGFAIYGRNRLESDPTLIADTLSIPYIFYDSSVDYGNVSVNTIRHDYSKATSPQRFDIADAVETNENRPLSKQVYVEGMGGVVTEMTFTEEFFRQLAQIIKDENAASAKEFNTLAINQARMSVYFAGSNYDWQNLTDVKHMIEQMDASQSRLGLYTNYKKLSGITDYAYAYEKTYSTTLTYGGYINRSRGCYVMDITGHVQSMWNYYQEAVEELGENAPWEEIAERIKTRTMYMGPEAYGLYTQNYSVMQGMTPSDGSLTKEDAPIKIDIAYTLVK